jgi:cyclic 2,3-diphosphoglycerate synthetase
VTRCLALVDGEHYAPVVRDALAGLPYEVVAAVLLGGTEKLRGGEDYGVPLAASLEAGVAEHAPDLVFDLSDEPVLGPRERLRVASRALALGLPYVGADFRFDPPPLAPFPLPSVGIVGTGKRVGKTALSAHAARLWAEELEVVVVAMGRGGPPEPLVAETPPTLDDLLALSREGGHAASDYLEDAALARVPTIGCRRAGGGLAGAVVDSNVLAGAELAAERHPDLVVFEGSGAALPPVATSVRMLVANASQPPEVVAGFLNAYRILVSDLVVLTMAEDGAGHRELARAIREVKDVPVVACTFRPRPLEPVEGRRVAFFSTAPPDALPLLEAHLRSSYGAEVVACSPHLARRDRLRADVARAAATAEVFLVELKAAAIDVVAEAAAEHGLALVLADAEVVPAEGDVDAALRALAASARAGVAVA